VTSHFVQIAQNLWWGQIALVCSPSQSCKALCSYSKFMPVLRGLRLVCVAACCTCTLFHVTAAMWR